MTQTIPICPRCQKPTKSTGSGFVTQFLEVCVCELVDRAQYTSIKICLDCRKRIETRKSGSITQWIFQPSACSCSKPRPSTVSMEESNDRDEDLFEAPELEVDPASFPVHRYKPYAELGRGGAGAVYLCRDKQLAKKVAVKVLHKLTPEQLILFQQEARAISRLQHLNIVQILDFGPTASGVPFMVLEYVDGISLDQYLRENGTLTEENAIYLFSQVCDALQHAHGSNIYHRDLKPTNILLCDTGYGEETVKLIDFGVARAKFESQEPTIVQGKMLVGTPLYMSPDPMMDYDYGPRSEIYALGCVMFEALSGQPPFTGESVMEVLNHHAQTIPPLLSEVRQDSISPALENLIDLCLSKEPGDRPASMAELKSMLLAALTTTERSGREPKENFEKPDPVPVLPIPPRRKYETAILVMICLIVICAMTLPLVQSISAIRTSLPESARSLGDSDNHDQLFGTAGRGFKQTITDQGSEQAALQFKAGAEAGDMISSYEYAHILERDANGDGNMIKKAIHYYKVAADKGHIDAKIDLARLYEEGKGVERNYKTAMDMYLSMGNDDSASVRIGLMYQKGHGVKKDYKAAMSWFQRAADAGNIDARYRIGYLYEHGLGVGKDVHVALVWYRKAADAGHLKANEAAIRMNDQLMDWVGSRLPK